MEQSAENDAPPARCECGHLAAAHGIVRTDTGCRMAGCRCLVLRVIPPEKGGALWA